MRDAAGWLLLAVWFAGCASSPKPPRTDWPRLTLSAAQVTRLNAPDGGRFDASALLLRPDGSLLTVNDRGPEVYRIEFRPDSSEADLVALTNLFTREKLAKFPAKNPGRYDCEGLAQDNRGRIYLCEEDNRWILRCDPRDGKVERLPIDWSSVREFFSTVDGNASFEGVAVGQGVLYAANERSAPILITAQLERLRVAGHFVAQPKKGSFFGTHYSDLCWFDGHLWILCRQHRVVLELDPAGLQVVAEYDYEAAEDALGYRKNFPVGIMEGLAVDRDSIWLVTDNNGLERRSAPGDIRPTLLRCARPHPSAGR
jgi:Esterase-like activity of phytase